MTRRRRIQIGLDAQIDYSNNANLESISGEEVWTWEVGNIDHIHGGAMLTGLMVNPVHALLRAFFETVQLGMAHAFRASIQEIGYKKVRNTSVRRGLRTPAPNRKESERGQMPGIYTGKLHKSWDMSVDARGYMKLENPSKQIADLLEKKKRAIEEKLYEKFPSYMNANLAASFSNEVTLSRGRYGARFGNSR